MRATMKVSSGTSIIAMPHFASLRRDGRIEDRAPAVDAVGAERLRDHGRVVAEAGRAPHVGDGVRVARVVARDALHGVGIHVREVRELRLVELADRAGADLARERHGRREHDVVARAARQHLGLEELVGIVGVVDDLDAGPAPRSRRSSSGRCSRSSCRRGGLSLRRRPRRSAPSRRRRRRAERRRRETADGAADHPLTGRCGCASRRD